MQPSRALSFGAVAAAYAEHRPGYPEAALGWALQPIVGQPVEGQGSDEQSSDEQSSDGEAHRHRLLDLGAGTGKLTAALLSRGEVTAVEPDGAMLGELRRRFPTVTALTGSAEQIPLPAASVDAVLVGQAWHWFDLERTLPELARVLRPGGVLAALWNADDADVEWVAGVHREAERDRVVAGVRDNGIPPTLTDPALIEHSGFHATEHATFPNPIRTTTDGLIATIATHSWALISEPADRDASFARVRSYLAARPETSSGSFELPMTTEVLRALRR